MAGAAPRHGKLHDLSPIFFVLFAHHDYGAAMPALGILLMALLVPRREAFDRLLRSTGVQPVPIWIAVMIVLSRARFSSIATNRSRWMHMCRCSSARYSRAAGYLIPEGFRNCFLNISTTTGLSARWAILRRLRQS